MNTDIRNDNNWLLTFKDLWDVLVRCIWVMIAAVLVCEALLYVYSSKIVEPMYKSTATLYILRQQNERDYIYTQSDFTLAMDVVNDCTYVLKSQEVLDKAIKQLGLDENYLGLSKRISTYNPNNTRFLEVSVEDKSPQAAKEVVDCVCDIGAEKITESMGFDQVNLYSYGTLNGRRSNSLSIKIYLIVGIIVAALVYFAYLLAFLLDTNLRTEEDIVKHLGVSVLAEIPNCDEAGKRKRKYGRYYTYRYRSAYYASPMTTKKGDDSKK